MATNKDVPIAHFKGGPPLYVPSFNTWDVATIEAATTNVNPAPATTANAPIPVIAIIPNATIAGVNNNSARPVPSDHFNGTCLSYLPTDNIQLDAMIAVEAIKIPIPPINNCFIPILDNIFNVGAINNTAKPIAADDIIKLIGSFTGWNILNITLDRTIPNDIAGNIKGNIRIDKTVFGVNFILFTDFNIR